MLFWCFALCTAMVLGTGGAPVAAKVVPSQQISQPRAAAVLTIISGDVVMRGAAGTFSSATDGTVIFVGNTIRTSADARAVITLFEGSTVELEPASDITIEEATTRGGSTIVELAQSLGRSWHVVTHLTTPDSRYEVRTPAATASVRGTAFEVAVLDGMGGPSTTVTTSEGLVATTGHSGGREVLVASDHTTTVRANAAPDLPRSAPAPQRVVTVTAVSDSSLVVDPLGRANGIRDGKVVAQTPGARVRMENGAIVVTLPNVPQGVFATTTSAAAGAAVTVTTTVTDRGEEPVTVTTAVDGGSAAVEVRDTGGKPELRALTADETKKLGGAKAAPRGSNGAAGAMPSPRPVVPAQPQLRIITSPVKKIADAPRSTPVPRRTSTALPAATRR